jgi:exodeoxyribonuclease-5
MDTLASVDPKTVTIGGYAGTGKTFLLSQFRKSFFEKNKHKSVAFCTFTGKASAVLKNKLIESEALYDNDFIGTIHSLIYRPKTIIDPQLGIHVIIGWVKRSFKEFNYDLIIIDEASMVSHTIFLDLQSYNVPIIAVGDHAQLPPVNESFNLMQKPLLKLTEIHRQKEGSPIIKLSKFIREYGYIPKNKVLSKDVFTISWKREECQKFFWNKIDFLKPNVITLCAFNKTRAFLNKKIRKKLGFVNTQPYPNERLICLSNNREMGIMNGQLCTVVFIMPENKKLYRITVMVDGTNEYIECFCPKENFGRIKYQFHERNKKQSEQFNYAQSKGYNIVHFDYGYCISVHKAQGSEWDKVILFEQFTRLWDKNDFTRWLYTAVTRAKHKLFVISNFYG